MNIAVWVVTLILDNIEVILMGLILLFSASTAWYHFCRTPKSDVRMEIAHPDPVTLDTDRARPSGGTIHITNQGDMDAVIDEVETTVRLFGDGGKQVDIPESVAINLGTPQKLNVGRSFSARTTESLELSITIAGLADLPPSFDIESAVQIKLRDNTRTYSKAAAGRLTVENLRPGR